MISPFESKSPDKLSKEDVHELFVINATGYNDINKSSHTFINGSRGTGKSMLFRYMLPDVQKIVQKVNANKLDYFSINVPIKGGMFRIEDFSFLDNSKGEILLNEHYMVLNIMITFFDSIITNCDIDENLESFDLIKLFNEDFINSLKYSGLFNIQKIESGTKVIPILEKMKSIFENMLIEFNTTVIQLLVQNSNIENFKYKGPICLFRYVIFNIIKSFKNIDFMPNCPIYILIDDADNLNLMQTKILNSWVSMRTNKYLAFKISTQLRYKTYSTISDEKIEKPHDYNEVNLNEIYTSKKNEYPETIKKIIELRLKKYLNLTMNAEEYFIENLKQKTSIDEIKSKLYNKIYKQNIEEGIEETEAKRKAYDFSYRNAKPDYILSCLNNPNKFTYSGFDELVNISSGVLREFIEFADRMYTEQYHNIKKINETDNTIVNNISFRTQNKIIREYSNEFFEKRVHNLGISESSDNKLLLKHTKLKNLVNALGILFYTQLINDKNSERRVFSFAISDNISIELKEIIDLAIEENILHKSTIGDKTGTYRIELFILNRILSPRFKLDPSSFSGYKFLKNQVLEKCLTDESFMLKYTKDSRKNEINNDQLQIIIGK